MNEKVKSINKHEIFNGAFVGNLNAHETLQERINKCRVDLYEDIDPPPIAMNIKSAGKEIALFTKGNYSIITGPPKSRKTALANILIVAALTGKFQDVISSVGSGKILLFDTEQSRYKVKQLTERIKILCSSSGKGDLSNLLVYSLRTEEPEKRLEIIGEILKNTSDIKFVVIDGIVDLANDPILQADQATAITTKLMQWSENYNTHISCILHYNKSAATLLGHIGSFSHRKAESVIEVQKFKENDSISIVKAIDCREKEFSPFAFTVDDFDLLKIVDFDITTDYKDSKRESIECRPERLEREKHSEIISECFHFEKSQQYNELWKNIKEAVYLKVGRKIGDNAAKRYVTFYTENGYLTTTKIGLKTRYKAVDTNIAKPV